MRLLWPVFLITASARGEALRQCSTTVEIRDPKLNLSLPATSGLLLVEGKPTGAAKINLEAEGNFDLLLRRLLPPASSSKRSVARPRILPGRCTRVVTATDSASVVAAAAAAVASTRSEAELALATTTAGSAATAFLAGRMAGRPNFDARILIFGKDGMLEERLSFAARDGGGWRGRDLVANYVLSPFSPYVIKRGDGQLLGVDVEVWTEVAQRIGIRVEFRHVKSFNSLADDVRTFLREKKNNLMSLTPFNSEKLMDANVSDVSIGQPTHSLDRFQMGLELSKPIVRRTVHFTYKVPGDS